MNRIRIIGAAAAIGLVSFGALAQTPLSPPPAVQTAPAAQRPAALTDQQILDGVNARIAVLKADLKLTAEQQAAWGQFESVLRDTAATRAKQRAARQSAMAAQRDAFREDMRKWREERRTRPDAKRPEPPRPWQGSDLDGMRMRAQMMTARASEMQRLADAAGPLYTTLDAGQRAKLMEGMRRAGGEGMGRGGRGRGGEGGRGWREDRGEGRGWGGEGRGEGRGWRGEGRNWRN